MSRRVGRPKLNIKKSASVKARLNEKDVKKIEYIKVTENLNTSEVIRNALNLYFEIVTRK